MFGDDLETTAHTVDGMRMVLAVQRDLEAGVYTTVDAGFELGLPSDVQVGPEGLFPSSSDLKTGDRRFDGLIRLEGDPLHLLARLGEAGRASVERLVIKMGDRVRDGVIVHREIGRIPPARQQRLFRQLAGVIHTLTVPDLAGGLARIATADSEAGVRLRAASLLGARFSGQPLAVEVGAALSQSSERHLQLIGAILVGDALPDAEAVEAFARRAPADITGWAIASLTTFGERAQPQLVRLLGGHEHVRHAAVLALGEVGTLAAVQPLLPYSRGLFRDGDLKRAARGAVTRIQARHGAADAGRLTIAADPDSDGTLSLADTERR